MGNVIATTAAPWSFSKVKSFKTCPKQFYHERVLKQFPQQETEAMLYGTLFHEAAEKYVRDGEPLPGKFSYAERALNSLRAKQGEKLCEYEMGLTADLEPCGFKDKNVWYRGIVDLLILDRENKLAWVIDHKTGKNARYADKGQLELMALCVFEHFPEIDEIRAGLLFVVAKELIKAKYLRENKKFMWEKWLTEYARMQKAFDLNVWNPNPSGLCKNHCPVLECAHNGRS